MGNIYNLLQIISALTLRAAFRQWRCYPLEPWKSFHRCAWENIHPKLDQHTHNYMFWWQIQLYIICGCLKVGVPQSFVLCTKKQGLGAPLGTPILRNLDIVEITTDKGKDFEFIPKTAAVGRAGPATSVLESAPGASSLGSALTFEVSSRISASCKVFEVIGKQEPPMDFFCMLKRNFDSLHI